MSDLKLIFIDASESKEFTLLKSDTLIGRTESADIVIPAQGVSARHAEILLQNDSAFIQDLGSTNGTFINGQRIATRTRLAHGDQIRLGMSVVLHFTSEKVSPSHIDFPPSTDAQSPGETMLDESGLSAATPQLHISIAGGVKTIVDLDRPLMRVGRVDGNEIVVPAKIVSREHASLQRTEDGGYIFAVSENATNPTFINGDSVQKPERLTHGAKIRIGSNDPGLMVTMTYTAWSKSELVQQNIRFDEKNILQIGRDPSNDIVLDTPQVSRYHAQVERVGKRYRVRDLRSTNGTFVNGVLAEEDVWLKKNDQIRIGSFSFELGEDELSRKDDGSGLSVEAVGLNKWVRKDLNILQDISLKFEPREFIVVVGQSGGGKSTLVDAIAGYRPATHGRVFVNGINVYEKFDAIRSNLGYVPQKDIIHKELTVYQALDYAAQLRMPPDTTAVERHERVMETLVDLDIAHRKDTQISQLSGGQQKRVSIGVELLTRPGLFFLDEPSSGLDPGTETALMQLMRRLADQGRTIVLITHATKNVVLADKVVFLARGGYLSWFGPPEEALEYFNQYRSERDQRARPMEFDEIYALLDDPSKGSPEIWAERFANHPAANKYIQHPLTDRLSAIGPKPVETGISTPAQIVVDTPIRKQVSGLRQFLILSGRNIKILTRDRFSLFLMLAAAPIVAMLDVVLASLMSRNPFDWGENGDANAVIITLFLPTIYGVMVGGISQMREIVKENEIYKRERLVNLKIAPYILSKVWVAALIAFYQAIWYTGIHYLAFEMPGGGMEFVLMYITLAFATMAGMMLGLFASAISPNANAAPLIVIMLMLPQIVLGGTLVPNIPPQLSAVTSTRWAFQAFIGITGVGSDLARDACFAMDPEILNTMSLEARSQNCNCLGENILNQDSCYFPAIGQFAMQSVDVGDPPREPEAPGDPPPEPQIPPPPEEPVDQSDTVAVAEYLAQLKIYQETAEEIQEAYKSELLSYQAETDVYKAEFTQYLSDLEEYGARLAINQGVITAAEGALKTVNKNFHWAWVNKNDTPAYFGMLTTTWLSQVVIMSVLLGGILFFQKRKDG